MDALKMCLCVTAGEEISGSEGSGSEEMDEGEDEGAEAGDGHRRRRGKRFANNILSPLCTQTPFSY